MRLIFTLPLLMVAGCSVENDPRNDQVTLEYDQNTLENAAADVGNAAENVANEAENLAADVGNTVENTDVDVDVDTGGNAADNRQ